MDKENKETLEEMAMDYLQKSYTSDESDEDDVKEATRNFDRGMRILSELRASDDSEANAKYASEKVQADRERTESQERTEASKHTVTGKQFAYDMFKVGLTAGIPALVHYLTVRRCAKLEETGRWNTKASNMALNQEPKMFNNIRI